MTREEATKRKQVLEKRREALVDQLTGVDAQSATLSSAGGSKSYTNRSVADIKAKIAACDREIRRLTAMLTGTSMPGAIKTIYAEFNG